METPTIRLNKTRTALELHAGRHHAGSKGCIAVLGGPDVGKISCIILNTSSIRPKKVVFTLAGNPDAVLATRNLRMLRADSGFARDDLMTWCEESGVRSVLWCAGPY